MKDFWGKVHTLRWDDHRYYHQCRINQTLHWISAISFLIAYGMLWTDPASAGLIGWLVGMVTRQSGHIFFEPRGYDHANQATYEFKETIKAGYNMRRKGILIGVWLSLPVLLYASPSLFGWIQPSTNAQEYFHDVGLIWLSLGIAAIAFRTVHIFFLRGVGWGMAWAVKILTDPFHNLTTYWDAPIALLKGQRLELIEKDQHAPGR
ncbi:MAG: hypothetical protein NT035_13170 [Burkholderiales bacterium]|jgi:hypothetical protein|nr:hypothetical protein [Burkholderiales bacterium]NBS74037.1 hypothetical protein [Betaproteobacteria bacterium]